MNTKIVPADIAINQSLVKAVLREQFNLQIDSIVVLGEGFDNTVFLVNDALVFRFPRRKEALPLIKNEMILLPQICDKFRIKIPKPIFLGSPSELFMRPFYGHEIIKGRPGSAVSLTPANYETLAHDLGRFLNKLHNINPYGLGVPTHRFKVHFDRTDFEFSLKKFTSRLNHIKQAYDIRSYQRKISEICHHAGYYNPGKIMEQLVHGDLYHRHLIFDQQNQLFGVIDWGDVGIADPVADLGIVYQFLPKKTHKCFFDAYGPVEEEALLYARFIGLYFAVALLWFGHDRSDQDLISTSLKTLADI